MNRKVVKAVAIIITLALLITSISAMLSLTSVLGMESAALAATPQEQRYIDEKIKELEAYLKSIHDSYKDEVDYKTLMNGAFEGAMNSLGDPYSVFFKDPIEGQSFIQSVTGEYEGIGITMNMSASGACEVMSVTQGAPAGRAGVKEGDVIIKINGSDVTKKSLDEISGLVKGKAGTNIVLVVKRAGRELSFSMTRELIKIISVHPKMLEGNIGYILLTGFEADVAKEFKKAKDGLVKSGAKALIIDIRDNPGGFIEAVIDIAGELIARGAVTHLSRRGAVFETVSVVPKDILRLPTVLLVNEGSASASEILAGALKDNKAAILVGTATYGKGVAQDMGITKDGYLYKISEFYFLTPDKHAIQDVGVTPDYVVRNSLGEFRAAGAALYQGFAPFAEDTKPKPGDTGLNVFAAQQRLLLLGFPVSPTATMDQDTVLAVKRFQGEQGLYAYGTLDLTTMKKIEEVTREYISNDSKEDLQLAKAIEILKKQM